MKLLRVINALILPVTAFSAIAIFAWPLYAVNEAQTESSLAQTVFIVLTPILLLLVLATFTSEGVDSRQLALLGVLIALNAVIRMLGAGFGGIETSFFLIIISGFVFRPKFGFAVGSLSMLVSGLLTGGVGPWLPFQMLAAGLVGAGAGLLPRLKARLLETALLIIYAVLASYFYGVLMTLWNWPFLAGTGTSVSYIPGGGFETNLLKFVQYQLLSGGFAWDTGRAITTSVLIALTAPALLAALDRAAKPARLAVAN
jgi:energy-coupling factor transport system substrate-specific component